MKTLKFIVITILTFYVVSNSIPYVWKFFGGTFMTSSEFIYKGRAVAEFNENCVKSWTTDFNEVKVICDGNKLIFINGVLLKNN